MRECTLVLRMPELYHITGAQLAFEKRTEHYRVVNARLGRESQIIRLWDMG
jgi:hypothetical protein